MPPRILAGLSARREIREIDKRIANLEIRQPDFIDLAALQSHFGLPHLLRLAKQKDLGFDESVFRLMLDRFDRLARDEFDVDHRTYAEVRASVDLWKAQTP